MTKNERKEYMRLYRSKHRECLIEYCRAWWKKYGSIENKHRREKYRNNPAYREKELERKRRAKNI